MSQLTQQSSSSGTGMATPEMHPITNLAEIQYAADEFGMYCFHLCKACPFFPISMVETEALNSFYGVNLK